MSDRRCSKLRPMIFVNLLRSLTNSGNSCCCLPLNVQISALFLKFVMNCSAFRFCVVVIRSHQHRNKIRNKLKMPDDVMN